MVSRKSHPKSRNGCSQCKRRRIKCDEVGPKCNNCSKHSIECDFELDPSKSTGSPQRRKSQAGSKSPETKTDSVRSSHSSPIVKHGKPQRPGQFLQPLHMEQLELLHHFTTETCFTLSDRPESHALWQVTVPQLAFKHEFLMHGIMAISALHLSYLGHEKQEQWAKIAVRQQDAALIAFRSLMTKMDQDNCDAFFALSSLVVVYGFDFPKSADSMGLFNYHGDNSDEWLPLIRGVNSIIMSQWSCIKKGKLNGLLHDHPQQPPQTQMPAVLEEQLRNLETLCETVSGGEEAETIYKQAVETLRDCFVRMNNKLPYECEVSLAFLWPVMIPQDFITKLNAREPEALIILAHYCVILHHINDYWWTNGWAMHIIRNIQRQLDEERQVWVQWPANVVGLQEQILTNGALQNPVQGTRVRNDFDINIDQSLAIPDKQDEKLSSATNLQLGDPEPCSR